jgi:GGDEF domain-containing protein
MLHRRRCPENGAGRKRFALSIRARLMVLVVIAMVPLLVERIHGIEGGRIERIEAASRQALTLARQGMARQNEAIVSARAFLQVAASAHGLMTAGGEHCDRFLTDAVRQVAWLKNMSLVDPRGTIICSSNLDAIGLDLSRAPHFTRAMQSGEFAISDYYVGQLTGQTLLAALPHRTTDGAIDVVVTGPLELNWFTQVAGTLAQSFDAVVLMVDGAGTLLARQPGREGWVGKSFADHPLVRAMLAAPEGTFTGEGFDGVRRVFGFVALPGTGARLAVGFDESDILRRVNRKMLATVAGLGLLTALVLIGIWLCGERLIVAPIRAFSQTAERLGRGDFAARARELPCAPEFVPLAAALDDMAGQLAEREQELIDSNGQLRELAYVDALTGIANRRAFNARLSAEWQLAAEFGQPIAVLILDVDHFKLFNDCYGHVQGDHCLRAISGVLMTGTRVATDAAAKAAKADMPPSLTVRRSTGCMSDFAARYGGEEFAVLLQGVDLDGALALAERLRRAVADLHIAHAGAPGGFVTVSIGVAALVPAPGGSAQQVVELADAGLYAAKRRGRNVVVALPEPALAQAS